MTYTRGETPAERNIEARYLAEKQDRTLEETIRFLSLRLHADHTDPDARLAIVYLDGGAFRRVLCDSLTGADLTALVERASIQPLT